MRAQSEHIEKLKELTNKAKELINKHLMLECEIQKADNTTLSVNGIPAKNLPLLEKTESLIDARDAYNKVFNDSILACEAINPKDHDGKTGLHILLENRNANISFACDIVLHFLQKSPKIIDEQLAKKILEIAVYNKHKALMLEICTHFNQLVSLGLRYAADFGNIEAGKLFLNHGANIDVNNTYERRIQLNYEIVDDHKIKNQKIKLKYGARSATVYAGIREDYSNQEFHHLLCYSQLLQVTEAIQAVFAEKQVEKDEKCPFKVSEREIIAFKKDLISKFLQSGKNTDLIKAQQTLVRIITASPLKPYEQLDWIEKIKNGLKKTARYLGLTNDPVINTREDAQKIASLHRSRFFAAQCKRSASASKDSHHIQDSRTIRRTKSAP